MPPLVSPPAPGQRVRAPRLHGSADALALAQLAGAAAPLAVLTQTAADAQRLVQEIALFAPQVVRVALLPDWETLPYDSLSPHQDLVSERLATLWRIAQRDFDVVVVPVTTALYRLAPRDYLAAHTFLFTKGARLAPDALKAQLTLAGYSHVTQVVSPGEYCVRGGLIDLFPTGSALPYRIELFDEEIESIRTFDADTQRSVYPMNEVRLLPAREFPLDDAGRTRFRQNFRTRFEGDPSRSTLYKDVSNGVAPAGIEYYLPLFFEHTAVLTDYLPAGTTVCAHGDLGAAIREFWQDTETRHRLLGGDLGHPVLAPHELFLREDELLGLLKPYARAEFAASADAQADVAATPATAPLPPLTVERRADNPLNRLAAFVAGFDGRVLVLAESAGRRETMHEYFREYGLAPAPAAGYADFLPATAKFALGVGPLGAGFVLPAARLAIVTENDLYATQARPRREREAQRRTTTDAMLRDLSEMRVGDPVVHEQHGVGRYLGLANLDLGEGLTEFLALEYAGGDKLYVPVAQLYLVSRYSGGPPETAPLHQLGSGQWDKAKRKAAKAVRDTAAELLGLYARRALRQGHAFTLKPHDYEAFAGEFPFDETVDQENAIKAVIADLQAGKPMDRLICGDVGFGKTEVALRAAFVAAMEGKQVAVLVPTTLLAEQHYHTFSDRLADWPPKVAELSRFRTGKEAAATLAGLAEGRIDIVIGTHKLLGREVKFRNLGLVIIDEEHRFGVRQKERLKALRAEVDVLTLTATPIPRTLAMALEGLRDFSVIATAPQRRLAIKTFVTRTSRAQIREAVLRELKRGGQVYFLHNDIDTIAQTAASVERLVPEARVRIAHGQMPERELESVMRDFYQARCNVLVCTTIIETGIDVPTANTIVIDRADRFGLAQLHQLRGRVGRSHHQAYAYLLLPEEGDVTPQARKRLEAIQMMDELGSGFYLAMHDLEIRGAGEVLGESQSGEMQEIGFSLYCRMLDAAVRSLKAGREPDPDAPVEIATEINLHAPALLPADYCADVHERLVLYKRLANADTPEALEAMTEELVDRFGELPPPARTLIDCHRLRILGRPLGVARVDASDSTIQIQFVPNPPVDGQRVIALIQKNRNYRLAGPDRLRIALDTGAVTERVDAVRGVLRALAA